MEFIEVLVKSIVANRNMPKVQVERELSPILEIFIEDILNYKFKSDSFELIAPEFPIQSKVLENNKKTNRSTNIDFLLRNKNTLYFVELKTDSNSFKTEQFEIYKEILQNKNTKELYCFLEQLKNKKYKFYTQKLKEKINNFDEIKDIKLVYLAPSNMFNINKHWGNYRKELIQEIQKEHCVINFKELKNVKVRRFEKEWKIISDIIEELDTN